MEVRQLGIPTLHDRCLHALVKLAIEPKHEAKFESDSYGYRPSRGARDAIKHVFIALRVEAKYGIEADIEKCFDKIKHNKLLDFCWYEGTLKKQLKAWLKAGILEDQIYEPTTERTPQRSIISPLLANIALNGLQNRIEQWCKNNKLYRNGKQFWEKKPGQAMYFNRYADDIRIFYHELPPLLEILKVMEKFLKERGLNLNMIKTKIRHTYNKINGANDAGVNYLGFKINHFESTHQSSKRSGPKTAKVTENYKIKLRIFPESRKINNHYQHIKRLTKIHAKKSQKELIKILSPVITGWTNYFNYSHLSSMTMGKKLNDKNLFSIDCLSQKKIRWSYNF